LAANTGLRLEAGESTGLIPRFFSHTKYTELAATVRDDFKRKVSPEVLRTVDYGPLDTGLYTMGRVVGYSPAAFVLYTLETGEKPTVDRLRDILLQSRHGTIDFLAGRHGMPNQIYETYFGLKSALPILSKPPFRIQEEEGTPRYVLDPEIKAMAEDEIERQRQFWPACVNESFRRCPAMGPTIASAWESVVEAAATDDRYFAADLANPIRLVPSGVE